jgi:hypothetical protein
VAQLVVELETDRDTLLDSPVDVAPDALASLAPEKRHHVYETLRLRVNGCQDDSIERSGTFGESPLMCQSRILRASRSQVTQQRMLRFHALLSKDGTRRVELLRT